jgi:hypothetical protein
MPDGGASGLMIPARRLVFCVRAKPLDRGAVREVTVLSWRDTILSHIMRLGLRYVGESSGAQQYVILKTAHAAFGKTLTNAGRHEVAFYTGLAPVMPAQLVPRCCDGNFDEESLAWHLLLEDLSESHEIASAWPLPPSTGQSVSIICALARLHAAWCDDARLGRAIGVWMSVDETSKLLEVFAGHYAQFADLLGDRLDAKRAIFSTASSSSGIGCSSAIIRGVTSPSPTAMPISGIFCCRAPPSPIPCASSTSISGASTCPPATSPL